MLAYPKHKFGTLYLAETMEWRLWQTFLPRQRLWPSWKDNTAYTNILIILPLRALKILYSPSMKFEIQLLKQNTSIYLPIYLSIYLYGVYKIWRLAVIEAENSVTKSFIGEKEKWTNKGNDKQEAADSLLQNTTSHTQHLYQISKS